MVFSVFLTVVILTVPLFQFQRKYTYIGLDFLVEVMPYFIILSVTYIIPIALLIASVFIFGRLSEDNEIVAIKTSGIHLSRIIRPVFLLGLLLGIMVMIINTCFIPYCYARTRTLTISALKSRLLSPNIATQSIKLPNYRIYYDDFKDGIFKNISVTKFDDKTDIFDELKARQGTFQLDEKNAQLILNLRHVTKSKIDWEEKEPGIVRGDPFTVRIDLSGLFLPRGQKLATLSNTELNHLIQAGDSERFLVTQLLTEKHRRYSLGLAPLIFLLIGTPVGILVKKGSKTAGVGISFLIVAIGYYPLVVMGNFIGAKGYLPPQLAVWLANGLTIMVALGLLYFIFKR